MEGRWTDAIAKAAIGWEALNALIPLAGLRGAPFWSTLLMGGKTESLRARRNP